MVLEVELEPLVSRWEQALEAADLPQAFSKDLPLTASEAFRADPMVISWVPHKDFMDLTQDSATAVTVHSPVTAMDLAMIPTDCMADMEATTPTVCSANTATTAWAATLSPVDLEVVPLAAVETSCRWVLLVYLEPVLLVPQDQAPGPALAPAAAAHGHNRTSDCA